MKILIADGSPLVADRLMAGMKEIPEVEVLAAAGDALVTLASVRAHKPEIVIVDARIAGARKAHLLQTIRRENPGIVLVVLSNLVYPQMGQHYRAAGADLVVDKSNEFTHLYQFVREVLLSFQTSAGEKANDGMRERLVASKLKVGLQLVLLAFKAYGHVFGR